MKTKEVLIAGTTGTTFMTLFSYVVSALEKENYSEPERLGQLTHRLLPGNGEEENETIGWAAHYAVGLLFALAYVELWDKKQLRPSFFNNLLLGGVSGIAAVAIWKLTFKLHPLPPRLNFEKYYAQLVPAHVVFAIFAGLGYRVLKSIEKNKLNNKPHRAI